MNKFFSFLLLMWIGLTGIGFVSCHSNTDYEETMEGRLVVLEKPYKCQNWCNGNRYKVVAHFVINKEPSDSLILMTPADSSSRVYPHFKICGSLPKGYQEPGIHRVSASLKSVHGCIHTQEAGLPAGADFNGDWFFYKLISVNEIQ